MKELGLPSLQYRKSRADMIEVFKILNGIDKCVKDKLFNLKPMIRTKGHSQKPFYSMVDINVISNTSMFNNCFII